MIKKGLQSVFRAFGCECRRIPKLAENVAPREQSVPYRENPETGAVNLAEKEARVAAGGPFEWPEMIVLNEAVVSLLGPAKRIVELGGGTGQFAMEAAKDASKHIICSEYDKLAHEWAKNNRPFANVEYVNGPVDVGQGPFDIVVSIEVVEHVADFVQFLRICSMLAPQAILTTPNRARSPKANYAGPPEYRYHVREWDAGELYWVLRCFYHRVDLYKQAEGSPYLRHGYADSYYRHLQRSSCCGFRGCPRRAFLLPTIATTTQI
jgi:hypothetical protein